MNKRHTLLLPLSFLLGAVICYIWFNWEYFLSQKEWWILHAGCLEGFFSPFSALLSGLGLLGVVCSIFYQMLSFEVQQFESSFFELLKIHRENKKDLTYIVQRNVFLNTSENNTLNNSGPVKNKKKETLKGEEAIQELFSMLSGIYKALRLPETADELAKLGISDNLIEDLQYELGSQYSSNDDEEGLTRKKALAKAYILFERTTNYALYPYFTHLYRTLKFARKKAPKKYWRYTNILRAQLSQHEFALLYYNALFSRVNSKHQGESPLKKLIEKTAFFHTFYAVDSDLMFGIAEPSLANAYSTAATNEEQTMVDQSRTIITNYLKNLPSACKLHITRLHPCLLLVLLTSLIIPRFITYPEKIEKSCPSYILKQDFMQPQQLTSEKLAVELQIPQQQLQDFLENNAPITDRLAKKLAQRFNTSYEFWLNRQSDYDYRR
ncbi:HigA family addiction module antitoxin [Halodesulfovibrio sp.]|jgi:addiction module HigA family antidote|uniref:HigA family addiction module antitoxin n=1 Tax=Halodesulfovibrio sp. TaxID=1912772 RepID=UPI0025FC62AB|nr:HigA family addiction module antitoxin [Halodesulfovibrio sp.]MCT4534450.1 HigA family addiction module antitoxin [Halodesulfovibrio sp.]